MIQPPGVPATHGELVATLKRLDADLDETKRRMRELVARFGHAFQSPAFVLAYHTSAGVTSLRWRMKDSSQRYFELCTTAYGEQILRGQPPEIAGRLIDLDSERIEINYSYQTAFYLRRRLRGLRKRRVAIKSMRTTYGSRAAPTALTVNNS